MLSGGDSFLCVSFDALPLSLERICHRRPLRGREPQRSVQPSGRGGRLELYRSLGFPRDQSKGLLLCVPGHRLVQFNWVLGH